MTTVERFAAMRPPVRAGSLLCSTTTRSDWRLIVVLMIAMVLMIVMVMRIVGGRRFGVRRV